MNLKWARGEHGNCGICGHRFALHKSGMLRVHTRRLGNDRFRCEGSRTKGVSKEVALRAWGIRADAEPE